MSLFEYDQGHLIPAQFGHPVGAEAQSEVLESVRQQVLEVISRPLFPVTWNDMAVCTPVSGFPTDARQGREGVANGESPRLTALDGSGQVVLVEVLEKLDATTLMQALARLGAVSNLGWNELAAAYPGGVVAFRNGWTQFRDAMPPNLAAGPRLVLVACEIDSSVRSALDALTPSGLEVHHVSVREMSNGRRFLDVQRISTSLFAHDTNLLAGRGARVPAINAVAEDMSATPVVASTGTPVSVEGSSDETISSVVAAAMDMSVAPSAAPHKPNTAASADSSFPVEDQILQTGSISRRSIMEAAKGSGVSPVSADDDEPVYSLFTTTSRSADKGQTEFSEVITSPENQQRRRSHREATLTDNTPIPAATVTTGGEAVAETAGLLGRDATGLAAISQVTGEDTPIFGSVEVSGELITVEGTLLSDGRIAVEGRHFTEPNEAAASLGAAEGWEFWHLGLLAGPSLDEARQEINAEIKREIRRA